MRDETEADWLNGHDARTEQDRRDEVAVPTPITDLSDRGPTVGHEPPS